MLGNGFSHAVLFAWVVPTFGLNWFSEKKLADVWPLVAGLLAFILMVVHFVFVAKLRSIVGMAFIRAISAVQSVYVAYIHHTLWMTNLQHLLVLARMCFCHL